MVYLYIRFQPDHQIFPDTLIRINTSWDSLETARDWTANNRSVSASQFSSARVVKAYYLNDEVNAGFQSFPCFSDLTLKEIAFLKVSAVVVDSDDEII